jgi:hypothetical protein
LQKVAYQVEKRNPPSFSPGGYRKTCSLYPHAKARVQQPIGHEVELKRIHLLGYSAAKIESNGGADFHRRLVKQDDGRQNSITTKDTKVRE